MIQARDMAGPSAVASANWQKLPTYVKKHESQPPTLCIYGDTKYS